MVYLHSCRVFFLFVCFHFSFSVMIISFICVLYERTCFIVLFIFAYSAPYLFQLIRWLPPLSLCTCVCVFVVCIFTDCAIARLSMEKLWSNKRFLYARALLVGGLISSLDQPVLSICFRCCAWQLHATCMSYQCLNFFPFFLNLPLFILNRSTLRSFCDPFAFWV